MIRSMKKTLWFLAALCVVPSACKERQPASDAVSSKNTTETKGPNVVRVGSGTEVEIQAAIDRLLASGGGTVELQPGLYLITMMSNWEPQGR